MMASIILYHIIQPCAAFRKAVRKGVKKLKIGKNKSQFLGSFRGLWGLESMWE